MQKLVSLLGIAATLFFAGNTKVGAQCVAPYTWHYQLNQSQRNAYIVWAAQSQVGTPGGQCKTWAQNLVSWVCGVGLPSNASVQNPYYWQMPASFVLQYPYQNPCQSSLNSVFQPGRIIQMRWSNQSPPFAVNPHTAIIVGVTSTSMIWVDSNWKGDGKVTSHEVSFVDFCRSVGQYYTVYSVY